jgi:uncharacterized protein with HEPN domain
MKLRYGFIEVKTTWEIIVEDIPELEQYCKFVLE